MAKVWSDVGVTVESATATAVAFTGATNANPIEISHSGTSPSDGDFVLITSTIPEIDGRVFRWLAPIP